MLQVLGVLAFIFALLISVMLHELGHFLTAKKYGMKVTEFFLGFGAKIWSFTRGETEFGVKAIPAGGYCRIVGMSTQEELSEADAPRAFVRASVPKRLVVLGAGSFTHFVLGFLLIFVIFFGLGVTSVIPQINTVLPCVTTSKNACDPSVPSPAKAAGLLAGDRIISINGKQVTDWGKDVLVIHNSPGKDLTFVISRDGSEQTLHVTPQSVLVRGKTIGMVGIISDLGLIREPLGRSLADTGHLGGQLFTTSVTSLISLPGKVPALFRQTFMGAKRDASGLVGVVGVAQASAQTANNNSLKLNEKLATFLLIIASLNIFVGIFNLLPLLPLDGGHMAVAIIDGVRRWIAKRRGKNAPEPIDLEVLMPLTVVVFIVLAALSLMLLAADIFNPVHFNL
jgi:membrane-associated protease RseP (regulator of RpoE activity)